MNVSKVTSPRYVRSRSLFRTPPFPSPGMKVVLLEWPLKSAEYGMFFSGIFQAYIRPYQTYVSQHIQE